MTIIGALRIAKLNPGTVGAKLASWEGCIVWSAETNDWEDRGTGSLYVPIWQAFSDDWKVVDLRAGEKCGTPPCSAQNAEDWD